jgi:hypothetical protein
MSQEVLAMFGKWTFFREGKRRKKYCPCQPIGEEITPRPAFLLNPDFW